jgi:murein hydrolase activator
MNRRPFPAILLLLLAAATSIAVLPVSLHAQNYQNIRLELQQQQEEARGEIASLRSQIKRFEEQITVATDAYTDMYGRYQNLRNEIALRNAVLRNMEAERASITKELEITQQQIDALTEDLETLIDNYKTTLTYVYKHGRVPEQVLLFTSASLNQVMVRSYYLRRFEEHRQSQARQITAMQEELKVREDELEDARRRSQQNISEMQQERSVLEQRRQVQERQVAELRRDRERLEQRLSASRREADLLENTLTSLIEEETQARVAEQERLTRLEEVRQQRLASAENIRSRREREAQIARYSTPVRGSELPSDDVLGSLESSFEQQKGRLPWPVPAGVVSTRFGNRVNPVYGTRIDHPGIEILTEARSDVKAVHDGYVFAVQPIPGFGNCVFVRHGRYITVYGNMSDITVARNRFVRAGEVIGRSGDEDSLRGTSLFFMIRDQNTNLDPEVWITSR